MGADNLDNLRNLDNLDNIDSVWGYGFNTLLPSMTS